MSVVLMVHGVPPIQWMRYLVGVVGMRSIIICIIDSIMDMRLSIICGSRCMFVMPVDGWPDAICPCIDSIMRIPSCMVFTVRDKGQLATLKPGDKVQFVVIQEGGKMVVTDIQPVR